MKEINGLTAAELLGRLGFGPSCACCGKGIRLMCETRFCGERCRKGKCGHDSALRRIVTSVSPA